ncbi:PF20097 family protein [Sedimentibacter sp. B4]|uniref:PF20097 family protein n=1 Tax=Sedimentibacter sp. B4 TaxID=304766 RepID=UPI0004B30C01|nr:PF20097 family protein [Sedimentibacter sp. B4]
MRCPYCNNEIEQGLLQGMRRVAWIKRQHKVSLLPKQGEVLLENNTFSDFLLQAHICKSCKKIVVDYSDKEIQEG